LGPKLFMRAGERCSKGFVLKTNTKHTCYGVNGTSGKEEPTRTKGPGSKELGVVKVGRGERKNIKVDTSCRFIVEHKVSQGTFRGQFGLCKQRTDEKRSGFFVKSKVGFTGVDRKNYAGGRQAMITVARRVCPSSEVGGHLSKIN